MHFRQVKSVVNQKFQLWPIHWSGSDTFEARQEFQPVPPKFAEIDAEPAGPPWTLPAPAPQPAPAPASAPTPVANEEVAGESR